MTVASAVLDLQPSHEPIQSEPDEFSGTARGGCARKRTVGIVSVRSDAHFSGGMWFLSWANPHDQVNQWATYANAE